MSWEDIASKLNKEEEKKREQEERAARQRERAEEKQREAEERARQQQGRAPKEWTPKKSQETVTRYSAETIQDFDYRHDITYRDRSRYTRDQLEYGRDQAIGKMRGIGKWSEEQINKYRAAPHFRVAFIKAPEDKTFALFKMNKEELQKLEREPELVLIGPKDKQIGVPVKVSEYLEATRDRNMAEAIRNQHMPLPETVYNKEINPKTQELELTYKEFELLRLFLSHPGMAFTRDQLMEKVWDVDYCGETRTVDMHIRTLRQKLGENGEHIETVRGVGYRWEAEKK